MNDPQHTLSAKPDPDVIYLLPACMAGYEGRIWCEDPITDCEHIPQCGPTRYVRDKAHRTTPEKGWEMKLSFLVVRSYGNNEWEVHPFETRAEAQRLYDATDLTEVYLCEILQRPGAANEDLRD